MRSLAERVFTGLQTSADVVYVLEDLSSRNDDVTHVRSRSLRRDVEIESALLKPLLSGKHVQRYSVLESRQLLLFPYSVSDGKGELLSAEELQWLYPRCWDYLLANREALENRENGKMRHAHWYAFGRTQSLGLHDYPKLAVPRLVHRLSAFYDSAGKHYLDNVDVGGLILKDGVHWQYTYLLALLNSKLMDWYFQQISVPFRGGFRSANRQFLEPLPIRVLDIGKSQDKRQYNGLLDLVEEILSLQERLGPLLDTPGEDRVDLERRIAQVDRAIDEEMYRLYGLTDRERRLAEGDE